ncbi:hypothetical protein [Streptosporangium sp. NPDC006930]|uniref:hypothetical protein n=1 Tax=Streptosporangium sp. NPDC006930 TaxID=3154783 RepID=UPI0034342BBB
MTITESELREILNEDEGEGHNRGVTVAGVHRHARAIRRRRWTAGSAVAAVIVAVVALNTPAGGVADDLGIWTGVMARPSPMVPTTSQPLGGPFPGDEVASGDYRTGGVREELRVMSWNNSLKVSVRCSGPIRRAVVWIGDGPALWRLCGTDPDGNVVEVFTENPSGAAGGGDRPAGEQVVTAAILPGEIDAAGRTVSQLAQAMDGLFDGWEEQLAAAESFPLDWSLRVREMIYPLCRDNVRQLDPRTGEIVRLTCEGRDKAPPG